MTVEITDRAGFTERVSLYSRTSARDGVYVVARLPRGDLVALNRAYDPIGFLVGDEMGLWAELLGHPAKILYDPWSNFAGSTGITQRYGHLV